MAGIYVHIPFCKQACYYCDFHFSTNRNSSYDLCAAIAKEIASRKDYLGNEKIETVYFGGGTPSILPGSELEIILESIRRNFSIDSEAEITLEANPDDLSKDKLKKLKNLGVNRLSIGIQSFDDSVLKYLNRAHSSQEAEHCITLSREAGFSNISLDLIYSIPTQDEKLWEKNIEKVISLTPEHISAYSLTIEEKTVFGQWQKKGKLKPVDDDIGAIQFKMIMKLLEEHGYDQYEISNFSKPGYYSRHNSGYWKQKKYLGVGPSAHSYDFASRQANISNNHLYLKGIEEGNSLHEYEVLKKEDKINEYVFTTLRTKWGCDLNYLADQFQFDLMKQFAKVVASFEEQELIELKSNILTLTSKGKLFADKIASDLFVTI